MLIYKCQKRDELVSSLQFRSQPSTIKHKFKYFINLDLSAFNRTFTLVCIFEENFYLKLLINHLKRKAKKYYSKVYINCLLKIKGKIVNYLEGHF